MQLGEGVGWQQYYSILEEQTILPREACTQVADKNMHDYEVAELCFRTEFVQALSCSLPLITEGY